MKLGKDFPWVLAIVAMAGLCVLLGLDGSRSREERAELQGRYEALEEEARAERNIAAGLLKDLELERAYNTALERRLGELEAWRDIPGREVPKEKETAAPPRPRPRSPKKTETRRERYERKMLSRYSRVFRKLKPDDERLPRLKELLVKQIAAEEACDRLTEGEAAREGREEDRCPEVTAVEVRIKKLLRLDYGLLFPAPTPEWKQPLREGEKFRHFVAMDLDDETLDTSRDFPGQTLLFFLWAEECRSCIELMSHVAVLHGRFKDRGLTIIGIDVDRRSEEDVQIYLENLEFPVTFPTVVDADRVIWSLLGMQMLPTLIVVDPSDTVRLIKVGYKPGFEDELEGIIVRNLPPARAVGTARE